MEENTQTKPPPAGWFARQPRPPRVGSDRHLTMSENCLTSGRMTTTPFVRTAGSATRHLPTYSRLRASNIQRDETLRCFEGSAVRPVASASHKWPKGSPPSLDEC